MGSVRQLADALNKNSRPLQIVSLSPTNCADVVLEVRLLRKHCIVILNKILGVVWGLLGGLGIGLPPVIHFGSEEMKERVVAPVLRGEKRICLAISMSLSLGAVFS